MATKLILVALVCAGALALPNEPRTITKNTIFGEERLEGEIFEDLEKLETSNVQLRNTNIVSPYRLPTTTRPQHYNVLWQVNMAANELSFSGSVEINLYATQSNVTEIVIHADDMTINSLILLQGSTSVPVTYTLEKEYQFLKVQLNTGSLVYNDASRVIYTLTITFSAPLRDDMYGIYKSWFRNSPTDQISWMASTQFQATAARYAFPCYDEPSFKATFDITIRRPTAYRSWSCTRIQETRASLFTGYQEDVYFRTPIMSTYLLALIVAEYGSLEVLNQNGVLAYEVIARPAAINAGQGQYALDAGQALLAEMSNHTAIDFYSQHPYLKMTQASIPDFSAGAMENWGLLTYREAYLMYDENHTNSYFKQLIAYILSHEIAHMWFGNLVTNEWWDVLWLNEGFARYYQYFLTYWVEDMGLADRFINEQVHTSLLSDSANFPQPLTNPGVDSPSSVSAMFSTIFYNKGAAIIRMTEHLLGFEVHREGLRNYLDDRSYDIALPIHLFEALQNAGVAAGALSAYGSDFSLVEYYRSWTEQPGHPVLHVDVNHQTGDMTIYQRRFNINSGYSTIDNNYIVPITFATASNPNFDNTKPSHIISKAVTIINRGTIGDEWVIFNKQQTGYYRVNYDDYTWNLITIALRGNQRTQIHEYNRAQIVNDVFQFARSGLISYQRAFSILSFLENETEYTPWVAAMTGFTWLRNRLAGTAQLTTLNAMIVRWATNIMGSLDYYPVAGESFMRSYLRYQLAPIMCTLNVAACRTAATAQFNSLVNNNIEVPVDSRQWVYCNALRDGTVENFNFLWNRFQNHNVYTEKILLLQVLGCTPHSQSLNTFLNAIVQENNIIRPQDYTTALNSAATGNEANTQIVFTFIQNNLATVINAFSNPATPLSYVSSRLRSEAEINAFQTWATANQQTLGTSFQAVFNGAENSRESLQYAAQIQPDLNSYFVTGDLPLQTSTPAPVTTTTVVTTLQPSLQEPSTPNLPALDSAVTSVLSLTVLCVSLFAYLL